LYLGGDLTAHPVPRDNHDRTVVVRLTPEAVRVRYTLDVDEGRAARDLRDVELPGVSTPEQFYQAYARHMAPILAGNLAARLNGRPLTFDCVGQGYERLDHLRCEFHFRAAWRLEPGRSHSFTFREGNYDLDDFNRLDVILVAGRGVTISAVTAPDRALRERPPLDRLPGDGERLRRVQATVTLGGDDPLAESKPTSPPDPEPPRSRPRRAPVAENHPGNGTAAGTAKPGPRPVVASGTDGTQHGMLALLFDDRRNFALVLLVMAGLGAAHALTPGHGKTLVAAYLVGERGTVWHALVLGLVTTFTHTGAVLALAAVGYYFPDAVPATVQATQLIGGLLIAMLGCWLLLRRLSGQADHIHLGHGHHHHRHDHDHVHLPPDGKTTVGWWHLMVLGMHGGIVPCWDAIVILMLGISTGRLRLALPLLLAFSAGLAGVLVALGIGVVWARRWAGARWGGHARLQRLVQLLPVASALVITAMGVWLCYDSTHGPTAGR
jgi:ABC-type nickel/cobalt efflux system permease component RcnA